MGCCQVKDVNDDGVGGNTSTEHLAIELRCMAQVPDLDVSGGSDILCSAKLLDPSGNDQKHHQHWPVMNNTCDPVWNKVRVFRTNYRPDFSINLTFSDKDLVQHEGIGSVTVPIQKLMDMQEHTFSLQLSRKASKIQGAAPCTVVLRMVPVPRLGKPRKKTVFFIRHGESKWNQAQSAHNIEDMVKEHDHGLSEEGKAQAEGLATRSISEEYSKDPSVQTFNNAGVIYSSPLTRAIQTGMIGMKHHKTMSSKGVVLHRDVREIKKPGGLDTVGMAKGADIINRVKSEMTTESVFQIDPNDCMNVWWTGGHLVAKTSEPVVALAADSHEEVLDRQKDLLTRLMFEEEEVVFFEPVLHHRSN